MSYQGDIRKFIIDGQSSILLVDGEATRDNGIHNAILYSLFSTGWFANVFADTPNQELGGRFLLESNKTITRVQLLDIEDAARKDLAWMLDNNTATSIEVKSNVSPDGVVSTIINIRGTVDKDIKLTNDPSAGWTTEEI